MVKTKGFIIWLVVAPILMRGSVVVFVLLSCVAILLQGTPPKLGNILRWAVKG